MGYRAVDGDVSNEQQLRRDPQIRLDTRLLPPLRGEAGSARGSASVRAGGRICLALALLLSGCVGAAPRSPTVGPRTTTTGRGNPAVVPRSSTTLPQVVLTADLGDAPAHWRLAARIPFG